MDPSLISSVKEVAENVQRFNANVEMFKDVLPYCRSWYALPTKKGWLLGPSKYIGYRDLSPEEYLQEKDELSLDGRVTENALKRWSDPVARGHPKYEELHMALNELCARFGKTPNNLARIAIIRTETGAAAAAFTDELVALLAAVFRQLTPAQQSAFLQEIRSKP